MTSSGPTRQRPDQLAGEEPMEIRLGGRSFSVTMRTPGHDFDLVAGFLLSEGVITRADQVTRMDYSASIGADGLRDFNTVEVTLAPGVPLPDPSMDRHVYTSSSCGICGTASIDAVRKASEFDVEPDPVRIPLQEILDLPDRLRTEQAIFSRTGGTHAAAIFAGTGGQGGAIGTDGPENSAGAGASRDLRLISLAEDVGRHNAVDKVLGHALLQGKLPLTGAVLQVSGRASFELVQKAVMAGVPVLSAVSAPSSLAVQLADERGLTLVAFNNGEGLNVYTHPNRIEAPASQ